MKQRHINCKLTRCSICFNDHLDLEKKLQELTGTGNEYDLLGKYHKWFLDNNMPAETEWGWASPESFDDKNIERFCKEFLLEINCLE